MPRLRNWQYQIRAEPPNVPAAVPEPDYDWFVQHLEQTRPHKPPPTIALLTSTLSNEPQPAPSGITYSTTDWPFLSLINPDDFPPSTQFFLEAVFDTSNPLFPAGVRLFNITDAIAVGNSEILTTTTHLGGVGTQVLSPALVLPSGDKEYRVERGGLGGSGATIHLHHARILIILN